MKVICFGINWAELKSFGVELWSKIQCHTFAYFHFVSRNVKQKMSVILIFYNENMLQFWAPPTVTRINVLFGQH